MLSQKQIRIIYYFFCLLILLIGVAKFSYDLLGQVAVESFKKLYSAYSNALNLTVYEMDGDTECYFSSEKGISNDFSGCDKFYKKFVSNLSVTKYCRTEGMKNGCVPVYRNYATSKTCAGYSESMMNKFNQSFILNDKTNLIVFNMPSDSPKPIFAIDSNGKMFPNKAGYDLFSLVIMKNSKGNFYFHPNVVYCLPQEKGGIQKLQDVYK